MKLAISGKGGVGKTTIAASIARFLQEEGYRVYAIDADPDANLAAMLGITAEVKPLVELKDVISERVGEKGGLFTLNPDVDDILEEYAIDHRGLKFLRMGEVKKASSACYCPENSFLKSIINSLIFSREEAVVLDMGAGIEHLTRGTAGGVDLMLIVCEPSRISLKTGRTIEKLALDAGIPEIGFIGNKIRNKQGENFLQEKLGDDLLAVIPFREELLRQGMVENAKPGLLISEVKSIFARIGLTDE